ncbi:Not1-domain-containing protein [Fomitiporia mediterranea MF3/22]|uniref:Not1-domain-containing protein n=1 Tax=Fomitiporia mediterranea (strain MF3/22) TaxID=694068 RepID=UPI0004407563|nr:Not1-domain-containing protein [Fomitiporia mediterranea MF3/22]EJD02104.1 Not1-domain-containing protein [Fomitiporia mediterranea MF3/22]
MDFENAVLALCQQPCFDHADLSLAQAGKLLQNLLSDSPLDEPLLVDPTQRQALVFSAQKKFGAELVSPILAQLFQKLSLPPQTTLVQALNQLGPDISNDVEVVRGLLVRFGISDQNLPTNEQITDTFMTLSRLTAEGAQLCDVGTLVRVLSSFRAQLDWSKAIEVFDWPERQGVDTNTLKLLIAILVNSPRDADKPAVAGFWSNWKNSLYQLRLLDALLSLPSDTFNFVSLPGRRVVTVDDVAAASPTIKTLAANVQSHTWNSLDLFEILVRLGDSEIENVRSYVREMLDKAVRISADIVHMGLVQVPKPWNALQVEYSRQLLGMFLGGHPNHQLVFMRIWQIEPTYLLTALREFYDENPMNITRILDVAQDLKILDSLLEVRPFVFALDVAALASRREYLNLDKWLSDNIEKYGADFLHSIILFLDHKMQNEKIARTVDPQAENRTMALSPTTIAIFLRALRTFSNVMDERDAEYCVETRNACLQIHPRLMVLSPSAENQEPGFNVVSYSTDIEAEVDGIFKQMYDEQITIDQVIIMLQRTKESTNTRDHEIFSCMLHFLFDEYKFFQTFYPPRELAMTGYLFGSIIQQQLVDYIPLGIAIRYVIDSLQCPPDTNLFKFGVQALTRFESRLAEWKLLCEALLNIPHLAEQRPDIIEAVRRALAAPTESAGAGGAGQLQGFSSALPLVEIQPAFTSIRPDVLEEGDFSTPPEETSDKILFIINNLAPSNFEAKLTEMKERFEEIYSRWLADYLVDQRVSTEPNNHQLYLRFLDGLDSKPIAKFILHETFVKSASMLNSDKTKSSTSERTILKNLASWLGQITLARDKPIKHKNLSFKEFLIEGADSDRLVVAIPFVCKVLEGAAKSKAFRPPNPWLMAVISLLAELYHFAELKLNLKFEIEVLCKALSIDLDTVEVANILRSRPQVEPMAGPGLPEMMPGIDALPIGGYEHAGDGQVIPIGTTSGPEADRTVGAHIEEILANLATSVIINHQLAPLHTNHAFKQAVQEGIDRAVREIILPVVERSVTIASITSRELCVKDFASEPNEEKLRKAGHMACQKLAGSLALVTCKDPLRTNMAAHIRSYLLDHGFTEQMVPEQVIMLIVQDNIDVACEAIEKAAIDRAIKEVDAALAQSYDARRRYRDVRSGQSFWDPLAVQSAFIAGLPDPLRIRPNGLQPLQQRVYEEFAFDSKRRVPGRPPSIVQYARNDALQPTYSPSPIPDHQVAVANSAYMAQEQFNILVQKLESILSEIPYTSLALVPSNHELRNVVNRVLSLALESNDRVRTPLFMSQKIVQHLYKTPSQIGRDIYVALLDQLCQSFEEVAKEAINWLICAEDERKFNIPATVTLLRSHLITPTDEDMQLAKWIYASANSRPSLQDFAAGLIRECLTSEPPVTTQHQFQYTLDALTQLVRASKATESVIQLLNELAGLPSQPSTEIVPAVGLQPVKQETEQLQIVLLKRFQQWVGIFQSSSNPEKMFVQYVTALSKQGILKVEDMSSFFFRVCAESSISHYTKSVAAGDFGHSFLALDAMSRLIVYIIKYHGDASGTNNLQAKVHYFTKILSILVLVVANRHEEQGPAFQQKPFFRFFSSLLSDLSSLGDQLGNVYFHLLVALSDTFSSLQPVYFPGFAFSWMTLISHRLFMPKLLLSENRDGWSAFHKLLLALFKFLAPMLRSANFTLASRNLYRGGLRLLLVLLHDFPDFLSAYYFSLCDVIPPRCTQLRNIVLSAFPASITLPDPSLRNTKFETIPEMGPIPLVLSDFSAILKNGDLKGYLDQCLLSRMPQTSLATLKERMCLPPGTATGEETYNVPLINAMVMYIGVSSVAQVKARSGSSVFIPTDPGVVALTYLAYNLDPEGQYHLANAMILQLRYPNAHTHWFCCLMLYLFEHAKDDRFREIMTRVLMERFFVHRPHPWGALLTFIELVRNPKYDFWNKDFLRVAPEVTAILDNVCSCIPIVPLTSAH